MNRILQQPTNKRLWTFESLYRMKEDSEKVRDVYALGKMLKYKLSRFNTVNDSKKAIDVVMSGDKRKSKKDDDTFYDKNEKKWLLIEWAPAATSAKSSKARSMSQSLSQNKRSNAFRNTIWKSPRWI